MYRTYKPPLAGRRYFDRVALVALNEVEVDGDDNDGDDEESLSWIQMEKQYEPSLHEANYMRKGLIGFYKPIYQSDFKYTFDFYLHLCVSCSISLSVFQLVKKNGTSQYHEEHS